uniref:Endonuclease domain-containing 1 protein-like n=2 Tax=Haplochromini TaxID=319058 RepID=A0A3Q2VKU1_HAPBU
MIFRKVEHLLPLAVLLHLSIIPTETKVVTSVEECNEFFLQQTPPRIPGILEGGDILDQNRYRMICQTFNDIRTFVTLYDTHNKIPVFSAAKISKIKTSIRVGVAKNITLKNQAGNDDYKNTQGFDRGHLFPSSYGSTESEQSSTFTLTNIVPQTDNFNQGSWNKMEICIKCVLNEYCINNNGNIEGFVVIGAKPSSRNILNKKINIPSVLWSAFCCYSHSKKKWLASAHWGKNTADGPKYLQTQNLKALQRTLGV